MRSLDLVECTEENWQKARPYIAAACEYCDLTPAQILLELRINPAYQLVLFDRGAAVLCKEDDAIHIEVLGGEFDKGWVDRFNSWLAGAAQALGCSKATLAGRNGWVRKLRHLGWVQNGRLLEVTYGRS